MCVCWEGRGGHPEGAHEADDADGQLDGGEGDEGHADDEEVEAAPARGALLSRARLSLLGSSGPLSSAPDPSLSLRVISFQLLCLPRSALSLLSSRPFQEGGAQRAADFLCPDLAQCKGADWPHGRFTLGGLSHMMHGVAVVSLSSCLRALWPCV